MLDVLTKLVNGGRKYQLALLFLILAAVNDAVGLGITKETLDVCLVAVLGGSGTIALEDGLRALVGAKPKPTPPAEEVPDA